MNFQKQRQKSYEDKIRELHTELEESARELGQVNGELTFKRGEITKLSEELSGLRRDIETAEGKIVNAQKLVDQGEADYKRIVTEQNGYVDDSKKQIEILGKKIAVLIEEVKPLEGRRAELGSLTTAVKQAEAKLRVIKDLIVVEEKHLETVREECLLEKETLSTQKSETEEVIKKNGKILSDTEINLHTIDVYVRRLQRIYDRSGIKLNILEQFGIKRDTQEVQKPKP